MSREKPKLTDVFEADMFYMREATKGLRTSTLRKGQGGVTKHTKTGHHRYMQEEQKDQRGYSTMEEDDFREATHEDNFDNPPPILAKNTTQKYAIK